MKDHDEDPEMFSNCILDYAKDDLVYSVNGRAKYQVAMRTLRCSHST